MGWPAANITYLITAAQFYVRIFGSSSSLTKIDVLPHQLS